MNARSMLPAAFCIALLASCGDDSPSATNGNGIARLDTTRARTDSSDTCTTAQCDASIPTIPVISADGGSGDVTTYGGVGNSTPSAGGACNYGATNITHYAAIQVNQLPGDLAGQWNMGRICGQCVEIKARTATGWKTTHARIVDKCPDDHCGIDLGGAPATDLMGAQAGRYAGEWTFVSCEGLSGVSDSSHALWVKEGSNAYWSLVQVRYPSAAVTGIWVRGSGDTWSELPWATEAENFFKVPREVLASDSLFTLKIGYRTGRADSIKVRGSDLAKEKASYPIP